MAGIFKYFDIIMCFLWIVTELLCLIGIKKYKKPVLPPFSQLVIAPFEFAVLIFFFTRHAVFNYAVCSYIGWVVIEIIIIKYYFKYNLISGKIRQLYIPLLGLQTVILLIFLYNTEWAFSFFGVFNTLIAIVIWYVFLFQKNYPFTWYTLFVFILKFCADVVGNLAYDFNSTLIVRVILILMTVVDISFFPTWFVFWRKQKYKEAAKRMKKNHSQKK